MVSRTPNGDGRVHLRSRLLIRGMGQNPRLRRVTASMFPAARIVWTRSGAAAGHPAPVPAKYGGNGVGCRPTKTIEALLTDSFRGLVSLFPTSRDEAVLPARATASAPTSCSQPSRSLRDGAHANRAGPCPGYDQPVAGPPGNAACDYECEPPRRRRPIRQAPPNSTRMIPVTPAMKPTRPQRSASARDESPWPWSVCSFP